VARSLHVRLDERSEAALGLLRNEGLSDSEAVRAALREAAARRSTRSALRVEAARLAADDADRVEMASVRAHLDELAPSSLER
jgi:Arc/MetJ-type ribon-helix-helix transcriptional regulator